MGEIYNISANQSFVDALANWILQHPDLKHDPLAMSRARILLPTRRGIRALQDAFLKLSGGKPMVLPRMDAIGSLDAEELSLLDATGLGRAEDFLGLQSPINKHSRLLILTRLVMAAGARLQPRPDAEALPLSYQQGLRLAIGLAQLLDQADTEGIDLNALSDLRETMQSELAIHWDESLSFLEILFKVWPSIMAERGFVSVAELRRSLIERQTLAWQEQPPETLVIAAGSTGSIPSTRALLKAVLDLPKGVLVLPGLDASMAEEAWQAVELDPSHPQFNLHALLRHCEVERHSVQALSGTKPEGDRQALLSAALLPAITTNTWRELETGQFPKALDGLTKIETRDQQQEAELIALLLRETLLTDGKTAVVITPDRELARRLIVEAKRWGIDLDDSAGLPLKNTSAGLLFRLLAQTLAAGFSPSTLLPVLKHPFAFIDADRGKNKRQLYAFEKACLRGEKPTFGLQGIEDLFEKNLQNLRQSDNPHLSERATALETDLKPYSHSLQSDFKSFASFAQGEHGMKDILAAHVQLLKKLDRQNLIWRGSAGESLAAFIDSLQQSLIDEAETSGERFVTAETYAACLESLIGTEAVRSTYGTHPRLAIWGTMEGRLQQEDRLILAGLNEGVWPTQTDAGPWLSRQMRQDLNLPSLEKKVGLSSHDFVQACGAKEVFITRAQKESGSETKASRLIQRMDAVVAKVGLSYDQENAETYLKLLETLKRDGKANLDVRPMVQPAFSPPLASRPKTLSITDFELLGRDPYSIYAKHVLRLKPLKEVEAETQVAAHGSVIHDLLYEFIKLYPSGPLPEHAGQDLMKAGKAAFAQLHQTAPGATAFWWPRFRRIATWVIQNEHKRRTLSRDQAQPPEDPAHITPSSFVEVDALCDFGNFIIRGRADRIDRLTDGRYEIIDYKSGTAPTMTAVKNLESPQLLLEALMLDQHGFKDLGGHTKETSAITYWQLNGSGKDAVKVSGLTGDELQTAKEDLLVDLDDKATLYARPETPYMALPDPRLAPRYQDYACLTRESEWRTTGAAETQESEA